MLALVAYSLKPVKLLGPCKRTHIVDQEQHPTMLGVVGTCCIRLHGPLKPDRFGSDKKSASV